MELLNHKGYSGSVETSLDDECIHGKVLFINDLVTYEAETLSDLKQEFIAAVEDYLITCSTAGKTPDKSLSGQFNVRVKPDVHKQAVLRALQDDKTLNSVVSDALEYYLQDHTVTHNHHHLVKVQIGEQKQINTWASDDVMYSSLATPVH